MVSWSAVGWIAEAVGWCLMGSFAVPMKWHRVLDAGVDPVVYQSWKTVCFFATSWLVLCFDDTPLQFTPWGLVSGALWVPTGVLAIVSIQVAGLAIGLSVLNSSIILVSFIWSLAIFREPMWSVPLTIVGMFVLIIGVCVMSFALHPIKAALVPENVGEERPLVVNADTVGSTSVSFVKDEPKSLGSSLFPSVIRGTQRSFWLGCCLAAVAGLVGGSAVVGPMKIAQQGGFPQRLYVISYAIGAVVANCGLWIVYIAFRFIARRKPIVPLLHFRIMVIAGSLSGLLWSFGMWAQTLSIMLLGAGVGNGVAQASVIVSGLWGILYYRETRGRRIVVWAVGCAVCLGAVALLSLMQYYGGQCEQCGNGTTTSSNGTIYLQRNA